MSANALYWFETQFLSRGYCCSPLLGKPWYSNYFLLGVVEFWLGIQALGELQVAAPWASWHRGDYLLCYARNTVPAFLSPVCFCFAGFAVLAVNDRLIGSCLEREEDTYLRLVQYKAAVEMFCQHNGHLSEEPLCSAAWSRAYLSRQGAVVLTGWGVNNPWGAGAAEVTKCLEEKVLTIKGWIHSPQPQTRGHVAEECVSKDNATFRELYLQVSNSSLKEVSLCGRLFMGAIWIEL